MLNRRQNTLPSSIIAGLVLVAFFLVVGTVLLFFLGSPPTVPGPLPSAPAPGVTPGPATPPGSEVFLPGLLLGVAAFGLLMVALVALLRRLFGGRRLASSIWARLRWLSSELWNLARLVPWRTVGEIVLVMVLGAAMGLGALLAIYHNAQHQPSPTSFAASFASPVPTIIHKPTLPLSLLSLAA